MLKSEVKNFHNLSGWLWGNMPSECTTAFVVAKSKEANGKIDAGRSLFTNRGHEYVLISISSGPPLASI